MEKFNEPILVTRSVMPSFEKYMEKISKLWENRWLTNKGEFHEEFRNKLKDYLKVENVSIFVNGHLALEIALKALNLKGEVITTPFTFASTTHSIVNMGLKPVFCDINMETYTIDSSKIEELITENTCAIMPVHVFGYPCNVEEIEKIAKKYNLKVIYDAAHVFGVKINGKGIGAFGDVSMFSLHATKVFHSIEGGLLTYNNPSYSKLFSLGKNFGITGPETVEESGTNAKMSEFSAAMGILNLENLDEQIYKRKLITEKYREILGKIEGIILAKDVEGVTHNYAYFPIIVQHEKLGKNRDFLHEKLKEYNIFTRKYFYPLITDFECYKGKYKEEHLINSKYVSDRVLTLPIYAELELADVEKICGIIKEILN